MGLLKLIKHYHIAEYALLCIILYALSPFVTELCVIYAAGNSQPFTEETIRTWTPVFCVGIGIIFSILQLRDQYYSDKTGGRIYSKDRQYKYTFFQLLDYFKDADPHRLDVDALPKEDYHTADGMIFGTIDGKTIRRPTNAEGNALCAAPPGAGKTASTCIMTARNWGLENAKVKVQIGQKPKGHGVLLIDVKGEIQKINSEYRNIKVFNPDDPDSCFFDPLEGFAQMPPEELHARVEELAMILIEPEPGENGTFFTEGAASFLCGITHLVLYKNRNAKLPDIVNAVLSGDWRTVVNAALNSDCDEAKKYLAAYRDANEKNTGSIYSTLTKSIRKLHPALHLLGGAPEGDPDKTINIHTLDTHDIYIVIAQDRLVAYGQILNLLVSSFMTDFMRRPDKSTCEENITPILFLLDEFPQIHIPYSIIQQGLSTLRSKNVTIYMIIQSLAQLQYLYGREGCRSIMDNIPYQLCMGAIDHETQVWYSNIVGQRKILKLTLTDGGRQGGMSRSVQQTTEYIFRPEDIGDLNGKVLIIANGKYVLADKAFYFK